MGSMDLLDKNCIKKERLNSLNEDFLETQNMVTPEVPPHLWYHPNLHFALVSQLHARGEL